MREPCEPSLTSHHARQFYKRVCPSVCPSICPSLCLLSIYHSKSINQSISHSLVTNHLSHFGNSIDLWFPLADRKNKTGHDAMRWWRIVSLWSLFKTKSEETFILSWALSPELHFQNHIFSRPCCLLPTTNAVWKSRDCLWKQPFTYFYSSARRRRNTKWMMA